MKVIHVFLSCLLASTTGLPITYDQRQEGELNVHAHLENFIIVLIPSSSSNSLSLLDFIPLKKVVHQQQQHAAKPVVEASENKQTQVTASKVSAPDFPAANSPYKVDLDKLESDSGKVEEVKEIVIAPVSKTHEKSESESSESSVKEDVTPKPPKDEPSTTEKAVEEDANEGSGNNENSVEITETIKEDKEDKKIEKEEDKKIEKEEDKKIGKEEDKKIEKEEDKKIEKEEDKKTEMKEENKEEQKTEKEEEKKEVVKTDVEEGEKDENKEHQESKDDKKDKQETQDNNKDDVPVMDVVPEKPIKSSKSIDFRVEVARGGVVSAEVPEIDYPRFKSIKHPMYKHDISSVPVIGVPLPEPVHYQKPQISLSTGISSCEPGEFLTDRGDCKPIEKRQRSNQYFEKLFPLLSKGVSAANIED